MSSVQRLAEVVDVVIGIDTHEGFHVAAVVEASTGGLLGEVRIDADPDGYEQLLEFTEDFPALRAWAIEGTASHGAGLLRALREAGEVLVFEVDRPKRPARRGGAKTDQIDALRAARDALGRDHQATPRDPDGPRARLQALSTVRRMIVQQATDTERQIRGMIITAPHAVRDRFTGQTLKQIIVTAARARTRRGEDDLTVLLIGLLRDAARRAQQLRSEAKTLEKQITVIVRAWRPDLLAETGIGPITAATVLCAWSHPGRIRTEAAFAVLAGVAPIPATSGTEQTRHRLSRYGDRQLNSALHIAVLARQRHDAQTIAYTQRRTTDGKTPREIRRCLKRYLARHLYRLLENQPHNTP